MSDQRPIPDSVRAALEALAHGERRSQLIYVVISVVGIGVGVGLLLWSASSTIQPMKQVGETIIPLIASALSGTRIAACETKIAQYRAAAALQGSAAVLGLRLIERTLLPRGTERDATDPK